MPDEGIAGGEAVATDGAPVVPDNEVGDSGQAESGESTTPEPQAWSDWEQYADHRIPLQVGGQEQLVSLRELREGGMRQADYTRKSQELAQQREQVDYWTRVDQAMRLDPQRTLDYLTEQFGPEVAAEAAGQGDDDFLTDEQREIAELREWQQQTEHREITRQIQAEEASLKALHGDDYDADAVLQHALQGDFQNLSAAFHDLMGPKWAAEAKALKDFRAEREAQQQQSAEANQQAAAAAGIVHGGHSPQAGSTQQGSGNSRMTLREAAQAAGLI